ncbi:UTP--glucose-1-phosphate uridylyltransferase [bacterium]|nr:UTP--glucose-1-phosphate uridylyltransferase [bacterium]
MSPTLIDIVTSASAEIRDLPAVETARDLPLPELFRQIADLERFRLETSNLYHRVRAAVILHAIHRFVLQEHSDVPSDGRIDERAFKDLLNRKFEDSIARWNALVVQNGLDRTTASCLATAYEQTAFATLADQVRRSVRQCAGNRWMFRVGCAEEHPLKLRRELIERDAATGLFPILTERTPVRMDLSHSGWSDIFFLGMDYPEGARVLNISVDLGVHGRDAVPRPPIETRLRVIDEPVLRLTSVDLGDTKDVTTLEELFNFGNDYLGLVKAGVIASGLVPASLEGTSESLADVLGRVVRPGMGLEVVSKVNDIPKGSRLAVSTNLLASIISVLMRATRQAKSLTGGLEIEEARVVVARAILGEWLGGSGGGWQDSGGVFPGVKVIEGAPAQPGDPEWQISRGRLLPRHKLLDEKELGPEVAAALADKLSKGLILIHGGMAQNVGPILNMVTEKYLLRSRRESAARQESLAIFERIVAAIRSADVRALAGLTDRHFHGPLKTMIPWVSNRLTETVIERMKARYGDKFWGFLMLGGMSGGGMGLFVDPEIGPHIRGEVLELIRTAKAELDDALPFAMEPVVYDFRINDRGTFADLASGSSAVMPESYLSLSIARMNPAESDGWANSRRAEMYRFASDISGRPDQIEVLKTLVGRIFPLDQGSIKPNAMEWEAEAARIREHYGFDPIQHARNREDLLRGRIGLARNRLPNSVEVTDVRDQDVVDTRISPVGDRAKPASLNSASLAPFGQVAVVSLAAGVGSRWTTGAGVVKAVNPFVPIGDRHRSFLEIHFAKTRRSQKTLGTKIPHIVTTSYLTKDAVHRHWSRWRQEWSDLSVYVSEGRSIAQRLVPTRRDLSFLWEESPQALLDENKQKVREAGRRAILNWASSVGEATDYVDNVPSQRFHPPGHFYEVPNLMSSGTLGKVLRDCPDVRWLMIHNIDTLGATVDPEILSRVAERGAVASFEVISKRVEDHGGGLARVGGQTRLLEGLAQPREETDYMLRYYNTLTTWLDLDKWLEALGLTRQDIVEDRRDLIDAAVRELAARLPVYVTIKDVKRRWGFGQEDVFPVAQLERLWGDISGLEDLSRAFLVVDRFRGQQLKDPAQLDGWANDGGLRFVTSLCDFGSDLS